MFQRELNLAVNCGERMLRELRDAQGAPRIDGVKPHLREALDASWRMESALGEFLAIDQHKLRAAGLMASAGLARSAFDTMKSALSSAGRMTDRSEANMKEWIGEFLPQAEQAVQAARQALQGAPASGTHRIARPVGQASPEQAKATVSIARTDHPNLGVEDVDVLVQRALEPLGGIERFVKRGQTVLLKPNQTLFLLADEGSTTDPRLVGSLTRLCRQAGAKRVIVGESSGGGSKSEYVMEVTGVKMLAERYGAEVIDFHTCAQREVDVPEGEIFKKVLLPAPLLDADVVINLPKMKTHNWDWISGALKNWVGIVRPDVRSAHHDEHTYEEYIDLHFRVPAQLHVMDAIVRGVGNGPGANDGEFYGGILASTDPVAMDAVAAQILGFDPGSIGFVQAAAERGLGVGDPNQIAVVGVPLEEAVVPGKPPVMGVDIYDANVIVGTGVTRAGTLGHFKSMGDVFQKMGSWTVISRLRGRPTIMIGDAEDPLFEEHLRQGPYVVIDDAAQARYKNHPGVFFIPGHPVLHNLETLLSQGLRIGKLGQMAFAAMGKTRMVDSRLEFGVPQLLVPAVRAALGATRVLPVPAQVGLTVAASLVLVSGLAVGLRRAVAGR